VSAPSDAQAAFALVAERQPHHVAIIDGDAVWTYAELDAEVDSRVSRLRAAGLRDGDRVALVAESSAAFMATALAVWRAGGVLVTIYPSSGPDDLEFALRSCDPVLVVAQASTDARAITIALPSTPITTVEDFAPTSVRADTTPNPTGLREPLSLICFSSGTTSRPKAIMLSGRAIHNCAATYGEVWHLDASDRGVVCLPMAWMYGLASTALALLLRGATVVVVRRARPDLLMRAIERHRATFLAGVTTTFTKLVRHIEAQGVGAESITSLRLCISGGEPRNEAAFDKWTRHSGVAVLDAYCSSECLPLVTYDPHADPVPKPGAAGKLVPRAKLKILDSNGNEVPTGEVGEGYSSGPGLMLGYWRDPDSTNEVLTNDGWYRTRDLVRMDSEGYVYVVGRLSDVIIHSGVNVSPAEVERVIRQHPAVEEVAVVGLPDEVYGQRVVAAVVPGSRLDVAELDRLARAHLTGYKAPSEYVVVERLPVNSTTGKVDRRGLAASLEPATLNSDALSEPCDTGADPGKGAPDD